MKTTSKKKTATRWKQSQIENNLKNEEDTKKEDNLKNEDDIKYDEYIKNKHKANNKDYLKNELITMMYCIVQARNCLPQWWLCIPGRRVFAAS